MGSRKRKDPVEQVWHTAASVEAELGPAAVEKIASSTRKWSPALWAEILQVGALGLSWDTAGKAAGVGAQTLRDWRAKCPELNESWERAVTGGRARLLARLRAFANDDPDHLRWIGERIVPELAPPQKRQVIRHETEPVQIQLIREDAPSESVDLPPEVLEAKEGEASE